MATRKPNAKNCKQITDLVVDYLNGTLTPPRKRDFHRHLRICPDCVNFLNTYKKTVSTTRSINFEDMPVNLRENVLTFLRKRLQRSGAGA